MRSALLLLGGDQGDMEQTLDQAIELIERRVGRVARASSRYLTEPWGFSSEYPFTNQGLEVATSLEAMELLDRLLDIEQQLGRDREQECKSKQTSGERYASRMIDIDIILLGDEVINNERLTLPHPRMESREFVLRPLAQIAPCRVHPISGKSIEQLLKEIGDNVKE
ncbi:MAG: 2-amino-4-hydroxy-6-hydroxymethyldihydropteridine diphosphokinase [Rikenellaceae bacterium]